jgi:RNA polymerase sigma-70 factor, ECF subfamily
MENVSHMCCPCPVSGVVSTRLAFVSVDERPALRMDVELAGLAEDLADAVELVAKGDRNAFNTVYAATSAKLFGAIVRIVGHRDIAEDVLQEVYVRLWQQASMYDRSRGSAITWLTSIARNRALDEAKRRTMRSIEDLPGVTEIAGDDDPARNQESGEDRGRLLACLDRLEPERKRIVLLAYHYGMTREEIARDIGRPVATVKTWLRRSLALLRDCLDR